MTLDLTHDETRALVGLLRHATDEEHNFDPPSSQPEPLPPLKPGLTPSRGGGQRRWGG